VDVRHRPDAHSGGARLFPAVGRGGGEREHEGQEEKRRKSAEKGCGADQHAFRTAATPRFRRPPHLQTLAASAARAMRVTEPVPATVASKPTT
jgi:hypothetical protein